MEAQRLLIFTEVFLPLGMKGARYDDPELRRQVDQEVARRFVEMGAKQGFIEELCIASDSRLADLLHSPDIQQQIRMILLSLVSATWTAFEISAGDAWQFALNSRASQIAEKVISQLFPNRTPEGLSAKGIPVWMAAKYGFDLRNHVGDLLKANVDFSDLQEIQKAYSAAFGKDDSLDGVLSDKNLLVLGATRHLIVHRSGIVDEKYNRVAGQNFQAGRELPLDAPFLSNILGAGIAAGCTLIGCVNHWLEANPV